MEKTIADASMAVSVKNRSRTHFQLFAIGMACALAVSGPDLFAQNGDNSDRVSFAEGTIVYADGRTDSQMRDPGEFPVSMIGWSRDGKIAFRQPFSNPFRPSWGETMVIADLVSDEEVVSLQVESYPCEGEEKKRMDEANRSARAQFEYELKNNGIIAGDVALAGFPISSDELPVCASQDGRYRYVPHDIDCIVSAVLPEGKGSPTAAGTFGSMEYRIVMRAGFLEKTISTGDDDMVLYKRIIGYTRSPFERRIAVIVDTYYWGIENECSHEFAFYGCSMDTGFRETSR